MSRHELDLFWWILGLLVAVGALIAWGQYHHEERERDCRARGGHLETSEGTVGGNYASFTTCEGATR